VTRIARKSLGLVAAFGVAFFGLLSRADAFEVVDRKTSYADTRFVHFGVGLGMTGFSQQAGISGNSGFGLKVMAGHAFNRYLHGEVLYQFSTFDLNSPSTDPASRGTLLKTGASLNQEAIRLVAIYPELLVQPFLTVGFGGYSFTGVNEETALEFPMNIQIPLGAGIRSYLYKNRISLDLEFNYQILFGENQEADTLALLGLNRVNFNTHSILGTFTFYFF
jgi:hypothetical protein